MFRAAVLALTFVCGTATSVRALPIISLSDWWLPSNVPGQVLPIPIADDGQGTPIPGAPPGQIAAVELNLFIDFGGPIITNIDLIGPGTIFNGNNIGQTNLSDPYAVPGHQPSAFTQTITGFVSANGILAYVTVDTTGVKKGFYNFSLSNQLGPSTVGDAEVLPILVRGSIFVDVPEPASIVMGLMGAAALGAVSARRKQLRA
jgi:hypothetical protein